MEELVNIAAFCNTVKVRYGEFVKDCTAVYVDKEDVLECFVTYRGALNDYFRYQVANFNFMITDTEVLVNKSTVDYINEQINKRINVMRGYEVQV